MLRRMILMMMLALLLASGAWAETIIIGEGQMDGANIGAAIEADGVLEITVWEPVALERWGTYNADTRNQILVIPVQLFNTSFDMIDVVNQVLMKLTYKDYEFTPLEIVANDSWVADESIPIVGVWERHTIDGNNGTEKEDTVAIYMEGGSLYLLSDSMEKPTQIVYKEPGYFSYMNGTMVYYNDIIAGGGDNSKIRSIMFRKNPQDGSHLQMPNNGTQLQMLEEATFSYVFKVPNVIINRINECYAEISLGDREFIVHLQKLE